MQVDHELAKLHAHCKCMKCETVCDVPLNEPHVPKFRGNPDLMLSETQVYFLGTCKKCIKKQQNLYKK
jgi:Fe2+ or Zn2+ uptake regulation protein